MTRNFKLNPEAFGKVHAAMQHVLEGAQEGNATSVIEVLDAFSAEHELGFAIGHARGQVVEAAVRRALAESIPKDDATTASDAAARRGLHVLVLGAGIGGGSLRCLPPLLENWNQSGDPHEIVSVEHDVHRSDGASQLVQHALGVDGQELVRHLPLLPAEDTTFDELLDALGDDGYELSPFDLVLLEGRDRKVHLLQIETLVRKGALRVGAVVHAEGPGRGDATTDRYLELLRGGRGRFDFEVHDVWPGFAAIIAVYQGSMASNRGNEL